MSKKFQEVTDYLDNLLSQNPHYGGLAFIVVGVVLLFASIKGYGWMYEGSAANVFHIAWIRNEFGESAAKAINIFLSVVIIIVGLAFYFLWQ
ncbi:hypothetical protein ACYSNM_11395 [Myroides sp. LJL116]